jgi:small-conductance mechanosensitive channel
VVKIDGKEMTFTEIAALPKEKKDAILDDKLSEGQLKSYQAWRNELKQVANQTEKKIDTNIQTANQTEKKIDTNIQTAINEVINKIPQVIPLYEADIAAGKKISLKEK